MHKRHIIVGLSGGVDSAVAAWLLKAQGHHVTGVFMKNWEDDDNSEYCSSRQDLIDAAAAADVIGIDLDAVNFASEYKDRVFKHFLEEYSAGRTPNPDVLCNSEIKFRAFLDYAIAQGADALATGHYAGVRERDGAFELLRAHDGSKDQSYFLHQLTQAQLSKAVFPLHEMLKKDVRVIAEREGIPNFAKKDSTGICFIGERPFREFLERYLPKTPGKMKTPDGKTVGAHQGLAYFTLGQRQGLGIGGDAAGSGEPWFVAQKQMARNELIVVQGHDHPLLSKREVRVENMHWIGGKSSQTAPQVLGAPTACGAKLRYRMADAATHVTETAPQVLDLAFDAPQFAPTPGQYAVLYQGEVCLGGGVIAGA
jgi:tRNA-uridine 2-sulfurtransferase